MGYGSASECPPIGRLRVAMECSSEHPRRTSSFGPQLWTLILEQSLRGGLQALVNDNCLRYDLPSKPWNGGSTDIEKARRRR